MFVIVYKIKDLGITKHLKDYCKSIGEVQEPFSRCLLVNAPSLNQNVLSESIDDIVGQNGHFLISQTNANNCYGRMGVKAAIWLQSKRDAELGEQALLESRNKSKQQQ
jgi:hypothetical protein